MLIFFIRKVTIFNSKQWRSKFIRRWEDKHTCRIFNNFLNKLHFLNSFYSWLNQWSSFCIESKTINEFLHVLKFHLLAVMLFLLTISILDSNFLESIVVSFVIMKLFVVVMNDLITCNIKKFSSMRNNNNCIFTIGDIIFKPHNCIQIQMVSRLIK